MRGNPVFKRVSGFSEPVIEKSQEVFCNLKCKFYILVSVHGKIKCDVPILS